MVNHPTPLDNRRSRNISPDEIYRFTAPIPLIARRRYIPNTDATRGHMPRSNSSPKLPPLHLIREMLTHMGAKSPLQRTIVYVEGVRRAGRDEPRSSYSVLFGGRWPLLFLNGWAWLAGAMIHEFRVSPMRFRECLNARHLQSVDGAA